MPELMIQSRELDGSSPSNTLPRYKKRGKHSFPTPRNDSPAQAQHSRSLVRIRLSKAKRVRFFRNGDQFFKGTWYAIGADRFRSFDALLEDLTRAMDDLINLPHGVRHIFTVDGLRKITSLEALQDGHSYVCASNESFKRIDYEKAREPQWNYSIPKCSLPSEAAALSLQFPSLSQEPNEFIRPRIITIIRNGVKPRKVVRLLLNKRTAPNLAQVLSDVTASVKLDSGAVRKIFTLDGKQVLALGDFFKDDDVFIAYGTERMSIDDFYLDTEEHKFLFSSRLRPSSIVRGCLPSKSPKFYRKFQNKGDGFVYGGGKPSPVLRRKFLHQRNQAKLKCKRKSSPVTDPINRKTPNVDDSSIDNDDASDKLSCTSESSPTHQKRFPLKIEDRYKVGRVIGDGNFAVVYHCFCKETKEPVALKVIDKAKCAAKEELVDNEVALLRRLKHTHIVQLYDVWELHDSYYLALEFVQGGDLFDSLVSIRHYMEPEAASLMNNLASALDYLHSINIVHRDVKPENLLLYLLPDGRQQMKLADFGLAVEADCLLYTVCGTPTYVSPEILTEMGYGLKVDVWAAGVILYIMLCGFPPFISMQNSQEELFDLILSGKYTFPSPYWDHVSSAAKGLIQGMLQLDGDDRYSAGEVLIHPWITGEARVDPEYEELARLAVHALFEDEQQECSKPSHSFFGGDNVEFFYSRRRSMDDLSTTSHNDLATTQADSFIRM